MIEMLVGVTILAFLLALGIPAYAEWIQNQRIRAAAESALGMLQVARSEAIKRSSDVFFGLLYADENFSDPNWDPTFVDDGDQLAVFRDDGTRWWLIEGKATPTGSDRQFRTKVIPRSVSGAPEEGAIVFNGRGRPKGSAAGGLATPVVLEFRNAGPTASCLAATIDAAPGGGQYRCLRVVVSPSGAARICDPSVSASGDPRGC